MRRRSSQSVAAGNTFTEGFGLNIRTRHVCGLNHDPTMPPNLFPCRYPPSIGCLRRCAKGRRENTAPAMPVA
jgi:hypothetical protein